VLATHDVIEKYKFMAFYEDIAMMCQSGLMRMEVAAYLFGYDAREASSHPEFVANLGDIHSDPNWALFWSFCKRLDAYVARFDRRDGPKRLVDDFKFRSSTIGAARYR
jgi:hypothetical protein